MADAHFKTVGQRPLKSEGLLGGKPEWDFPGARKRERGGGGGDSNDNNHYLLF